MGKQYVVAKASDIPEGGRLITEIAGRSIGVFNVEGTFYALRNRCPHIGGPLCEGGPVYSLFEASKPGEYHVDHSKKFVTCPWHGWEYDIATGQSWWNPAQHRVRAYAVSVVPGGAQAGDPLPSNEGDRTKGPYVAEAYPVTVADAVVVVEIPD